MFPDHSLIGIVAIDFAVYDDGAQKPNSRQFVENGASSAGSAVGFSVFNVAVLDNALMGSGVSEFK